MVVVVVVIADVVVVVVFVRGGRGAVVVGVSHWRKIVTSNKYAVT